MGCFPVHGEKQAPGKRRKWTLWWNFSFVSSKSSKSSSNSSDSAPEESIPKLQDLRVFSLQELKNATKNFLSTEKLGEGGFGAVYRGHIKATKSEERIDVAVKQLNVKGQQGQKEWLNEITYLRMVDHPNLVKLIGYCVEDDERGPQSLLVYEFMPNKSLDDHIFRIHGPVLPWKSRLQIALGTAKGLAYLHEEMKPQVWSCSCAVFIIWCLVQIIYRDLKAANILLDHEFKPKLSDFGLARHGPSMENTHVTTAVVGTQGYAAPEYVQTGHLTAKSDVWSFGMVLLELITGRKALDRNRPRTERSLADWVKPYLNDNKRFGKIIDPRLRKQFPIEEVKRVLAVAQKCIAKQPKSRPKMSEVVRQLEAIMNITAAPDEKLSDVSRDSTVRKTASTRSTGSRNASMASMADISETGGSRRDSSSYAEEFLRNSPVADKAPHMPYTCEEKSGTASTKSDSDMGVGKVSEDALTETALQQHGNLESELAVPPRSSTDAQIQETSVPQAPTVPPTRRSTEARTQETSVLEAPVVQPRRSTEARTEEMSVLEAPVVPPRRSTETQTQETSVPEAPVVQPRRSTGAQTQETSVPEAPVEDVPEQQDPEVEEGTSGVKSIGKVAVAPTES